MLSDADAQKIRIGELTGKRKLLSQRFELHPSETRLALELKIIDDQIAEWTREIQKDKKSR